MKRLRTLFIAALLVASAVSLKAHDRRKSLVITMTNDPAANALVVLDADTHARLQTLSTNGKGGVGGNARGIKEFNGRLLAAVNFGSGTVALFRRSADRLEFEQLVVPTSAPVSVDFGNGHMYVAGARSVDSFVLYGNHVGRLDGTTPLLLADNGVLTDTATAQVGVVDEHSLLVTMKTDPIPGTVDVVHLRNGAVSGQATPISAPAGTLTPFGFSVYPDGTAVITLAHSGHNGLFRNESFKSVANSADGAGNCWSTLVGKYVFIVNTGKMSIARVVGTGSNIFTDSVVAAKIATGGSPTDIDADGGYLSVIDHTSGAGASSHLTLFSYDEFGELVTSGNPVDLMIPNANGVAIMTPDHDED